MGLVINKRQSAASYPNYHTPNYLSNKLPLFVPMQSTNTVKQEGNPAIVLKRCEKMLIQMRMETHLKEVRNNCKSKWSDLLPFKDGRQINCRIRYGLFEFVILKTEQPIVLRVAVCTRARV